MTASHRPEDTVPARLLGVDLGTRRVGIAVADPATGAVRPLATIRRGSLERDAATLAHLRAEQGATEVIVGLPLHLDGREGPQAAETRAWAAEMALRLPVPVRLRDERLTSVRAEEVVGRMTRGRSGGPPTASSRAAHRARIDRLAAVGILQAELDERTRVPA